MTQIDRTVVGETWARGAEETEGWMAERGGPGVKHEEGNVGDVERIVSVAAGCILVATGIARRSVPGAIVAGIGGALVFRGATGFCRVYEALGIDTCEHADGQTQLEAIRERGVHVQQSCLINKSAEELYRFWRNFENLPRFMNHLESVRTVDNRRSHWVAKAPRFAGGTVEWDAEITRDEPNSLIAWRSIEGSDVDSVGEIRFGKGHGDRGTDVRVTLDYIPPAGKLGHWVASLFGQSAQQQIREELRNFKRLMECGEVITIAGQSHGSCMGLGNVLRE